MPTAAGPPEQHRRTRRLETGWRFHRGDVGGGADPALDDGDWEAVDVPHDWSIEGPFDPDNPGGEQQGFAPGGVGWYRRTLPADVDGEATLRFDGVYRDFDVYVDGEHVGHRPYGYSTVTYDLADFDVSGAGEIAGVDNGNLDSDEPWVGDARSAYRGTCIAVVRAARDAGMVDVEAAVDGLAGDSVSIVVEDLE